MLRKAIFVASAEMLAGSAMEFAPLPLVLTLTNVKMPDTRSRRKISVVLGNVLFEAEKTILLPSADTSPKTSALELLTLRCALFPVFAVSWTGFFFISSPAAAEITQNRGA